MGSDLVAFEVDPAGRTWLLIGESFVRSHTPPCAQTRIDGAEPPEFRGFHTYILLRIDPAGVVTAEE